MRLIIDPRINVPFLAQMAGLGPEWSPPVIDNGLLLFTFRDDALEAVEGARADYPAAYLADAKMKYLERMAAIRWQRELIGPLGMVLDEKTVNRINGAVVLLNNNVARQYIKFEARRGQFMTIPRANMLALGVAIGEYIQALFEHVSDQTDLIMAVALPTIDLDGLDVALAELAAIDLEAGWPDPVTV